MADTKTAQYIEGIGRRKNAVARVRIVPGAKATTFSINDKDLDTYFKTDIQKVTAQEALTKHEVADKFAVTVKVQGGGLASQAESVRLGLARALVELDAESRKDLKKLGFLKRDPRSKERRHFGLKKARKAPQWSKR